MSNSSKQSGSGSGSKRKGSDLMNQFGFGVPISAENPGAVMPNETDDADGDDLEAELAAITGENPPSSKKPPSNKKVSMTLSEMERMAALGLQEVNEEDRLSDTEDPELLSELAELQAEGNTEVQAEEDAAAAVSTSTTSPVDVTPHLSNHQATLSLLPATDDAQSMNETLSATISQTSRHQTPDDQESGRQPSTETTELPPEPNDEEAQRLFQAPPAPKNVMEALTQRLERYKSSEVSARQAGNSSKTRRMGRIVKQYETAIRCHREGKPVNFDELPIPPGFGPIPADLESGPGTSPDQQAAGAALGEEQETFSQEQGSIPSGASGAVDEAYVSQGSNPQQQYLVRFLRERKEEFRKAALWAKKNENKDQAVQHLRCMKGMDSLIESAEAGKPVDLSQVPPSPLNTGRETDSVTVPASASPPGADRSQLFAQLEQDLITQIRISATNSQHFAHQGDIVTADKFKKLEQGCRRDLESLKTACQSGDPVPKFRYESRTFSSIQCNTNLGDAEMEVTVVRGINFSLPSGFAEKDMDTMIKYEFAFPSEEPQTGQTPIVKGTINPECNHIFKLQIDRKSRSFARFVERKGIKMEVYVKRGLFKDDKLLGSAMIKLTTLDTKCTLHDSFDLVDGRKLAGGKLEIKVRVRDPFKGRHVEETNVKWLVIDQFLHSVDSKVPNQQRMKSRACVLL